MSDQPPTAGVIASTQALRVTDRFELMQLPREIIILIIEHLLPPPHHDYISLWRHNSLAYRHHARTIAQVSPAFKDVVVRLLARHLRDIALTYADRDKAWTHHTIQIRDQSREEIEFNTHVCSICGKALSQVTRLFTCYMILMTTADELELGDDFTKPFEDIVDGA